MKKFLRILIWYSVCAPQVFGTDVKFIVDIPYYVEAPSVENLSIKDIARYEDLNGVEYSEEEGKQFETGKFRYRISKNEFRGWLIPSRYVTVEQEEEVKNESSRKLDDFIAMFRNTSFEKTEAESGAKFDSHVLMFLLLNRAESPCEYINQQLYLTGYHMNRDANVFVSFAFWRPKWERGVGKNTVNVDISEVKTYFSKLLKYDIDHESRRTIEFLRQVESGIKETNHVPYRELREMLRIDGIKGYAFDKLNPDGQSLVYECIHDSDITSLRGDQGTGLYSHYTEQVLKEKPNLMTTGYCADKRFKPEEISKEIMDCISNMVDSDMSYRSIIATNIDPRFVYFPEPNFIVRAEKVEGKPFVMHYSFLEEGSDWIPDGNVYFFKDYEPHESSILLANMYERVGNPKIIFESSYPIVMALPDRMFKNKKGRGKYFTDEKEVRPENLSQHFLNRRNSAMVAYRQFGLEGSTGFAYMNCIFTSVYCSFFKVNNSNVILFKENLKDNRANKILIRANNATDVEEQRSILDRELLSRFKEVKHTEYSLATLFFNARRVLH